MGLSTAWSSTIPFTPLTVNVNSFCILASAYGTARAFIFRVAIFSPAAISVCRVLHSCQVTLALDTT